jgi:hypothetical protein
VVLRGEHTHTASANRTVRTHLFGPTASTDPGAADRSPGS